MHRGYFRLGIVLTTLWFAIVAAIVLYEFWSRNFFCQIAPFNFADPVCQHFFWSWVQVDKTAEFSLNVFRLLLSALGPPTLGWLLGLAIDWVRKGFQPDAT